MAYYNVICYITIIDHSSLTKGFIMLTTEEVKRIAKIMLEGSPKTLEKVDHITRQLQNLPDAIRADFGAVNLYLIELLDNGNKRKVSTFTRNEISKMTASEIIERFCPGGEAVEGVTVDQDYNREITTLWFEGFSVDIHNNTKVMKESR
jgi:hypothetical protein